LAKLPFEKCRWRSICKMLGADDFANKNSVVATGVNLPGLAFNMRKRVAD
jgi:predicted membrane-bound mannosyltransferase